MRSTAVLLLLLPFFTVASVESQLSSLEALLSRHAAHKARDLNSAVATTESVAGAIGHAAVAAKDYTVDGANMVISGSKDAYHATVDVYDGSVEAVHATERGYDKVVSLGSSIANVFRRHGRAGPHRRYVWSSTIINDVSGVIGQPSTNENVNELNGGSVDLATPSAVLSTPTLVPSSVAARSPHEIISDAVLASPTDAPYKLSKADAAALMLASEGMRKKRYVWSNQIIQDGDAGPSPETNVDALSGTPRDISHPVAALVAPSFPPIAAQSAAAPAQVSAVPFPKDAPLPAQMDTPAVVANLLAQPIAIASPASSAATPAVSLSSIAAATSATLLISSILLSASAPSDSPASSAPASPAPTSSTHRHHMHRHHHTQVIQKMLKVAKRSELDDAEIKVESLFEQGKAMFEVDEKKVQSML